jgi:H+/Cl- antiporter ClcA
MGDNLGKNFAFPPAVSQPLNMLLAVPIAVVGAAGGMVFHFSSIQLNKYFAALANRPVLRGILGGVGLGIMGSLLPLSLFSGEHELRILIDESAKMGFVLLLVLGVVKMVVTTLCLASGWKGGIIFPPMFGGAALGLACSLLFPVIHPMVGVTAGMAATAAVIMRQPLAVIIILLGILRGETAGVIVVATLVGYLITMPFFPSKNKANE